MSALVNLLLPLSVLLAITVTMGSIVLLIVSVFNKSVRLRKLAFQIGIPSLVYCIVVFVLVKR